MHAVMEEKGVIQIIIACDDIVYIIRKFVLMTYTYVAPPMHLRVHGDIRI